MGGGMLEQYNSNGTENKGVSVTMVTSPSMMITFGEEGIWWYTKFTWFEHDHRKNHDPSLPKFTAAFVDGHADYLLFQESVSDTEDYTFKTTD
jgi:hypothetical protein